MVDLPPLGGFAIIDKRPGWTSHDAVAKLRGILGTRRVGHAGTLDPMATGVLVCGVGRATRLLGYVSGCDKEYEATVRLGQTTDTDDAEGQIIAEVDAASIRVEQVLAELAALAAQRTQRPSSVSAIKVAGQRAYRRVRAGETVELPPRPMRISRLELVANRPGPDLDGGGSTMDLDIQVECSSGTYVRAIARDLGASLGVGGHLVALRRTRVGQFGVDLATPLAQATLIGIDEVCRRLFVSLDLSQEQAVDVSHGRAIEAAADESAPTDETASVPRSVTVPESAHQAPCQSPPESVLAAFAPTGQVIALVALRDDHWRPTLVVRPASG